MKVALGVLLLLALPLGVLAWLTWSWWRFRAYHRHKALALDVPAGVMVRGILSETRAVLTLLWWQLRAFGRDPLRLPSHAPEDARPVLCVHGIVQNGTNMWGIRQALEARGRPTRAVSLGRLRLRLEAYMPALEVGLRELAARSPDGKVDVVAHSMGGVILRMVLAAHPELAPHVGRVVTLGSPHAGTAAARGMPLTVVRDLGRRSKVLPALPGFPEHVEVVTVTGGLDFVVYPNLTSHLPGGRVLHFPQVGHTGLLARVEVIAAVVEALEGVQSPSKSQALTYPSPTAWTSRS